MADDTEIDNGPNLPTYKMRTDDVGGGVRVPYVKLDVGGDGVSQPADNSHPVPTASRASAADFINVPAQSVAGHTIDASGVWHDDGGLYETDSSAFPFSSTAGYGFIAIAAKVMSAGGAGNSGQLWIDLDTDGVAGAGNQANWWEPFTWNLSANDTFGRLIAIPVLNYGFFRVRYTGTPGDLVDIKSCLTSLSPLDMGAANAPFHRLEQLFDYFEKTLSAAQYRFATKEPNRNLSTDNKTSTTPGTAVLITSAAGTIDITALSTNVGPVYVGDSSVKASTKRGRPLAPGGFYSLTNLAGTSVYMDVTNSGDGVSFNNSIATNSYPF